MPRSEDLLFAPSKFTVVASGTNTTVTAAQAAPFGKQRNYIAAISVSASAAPATTVSVQVREAAGTIIHDRFELPAAAFAPIVINYVRPIEIGQGANCDVTMPALGAGVVGTVVLRGFATTS
jgi:hypothetical protein